MKKFKPQTKSKTLHIYLHKHKNKIDEIKRKYKVSYSTIARLIGEEILKPEYWEKEQYPKIVQETLHKYYFTSDKLLNPSTIKPRKIQDYIQEDFLKTTNEKQIFYTNCLYWYTKKFELISDKENAQKLYNRVNNKLSKERETFWDLNNQIRSNKRAFKILGATKK